MSSVFPSFGEVFITNDEVDGCMENLRLFKGKLISNICGGCKKLFIIEDGHGNEGVISTLHSPENDQYDQTFSEQEGKHPQDADALLSFDNKGQVKKIATGKKHTTFITDEGKVYSYGYGEYGALGHGGMIQTNIPKLISRLSSRKVVQLACGEFHTLALTQEHDLYAWGRGFEGQLGVRDDVDTTSVPMFVSYFYKNPAVTITCGAYHSLAIDGTGRMYAWGEARFGQLGNGKQVKETTPIMVSLTVEQAQIYQTELQKYEAQREKKRLMKQQAAARRHKKHSEDQPPEVSPPKVQGPNPVDSKLQSRKTKVVEFIKENTTQSQFKITPLTNLNPDPNPSKVIGISAGYGHSACVTEAGEIYTFGFNQRGQLGHGDAKSRYYPKMVTQDLLGKQVPIFRKVSCGYYTTFAIDSDGHVWSWGGGNIGHKGDRLSDLPRRIIENTENRKFLDVMATSQAAVFFAGMRTLSIRPNYGPSCGGTLITLIGTGFCDTGRQSVRFTFGKNCVQEVAGIYDEMTDSFSCTTPRFEEIEELVQWPLDCKVEVTLDGIVYTVCEQKFLIYSSKLCITQLFPKCASVEGGTTLILNINIDDKTSSYMKHLNIGFQPRSKKEKDLRTVVSPSSQMISHSKQPSQQDINVKKQSQHSNLEPKNQLNPLDLSTNDPELDKENWICVEGFYEKGKISCTVPNVSNSATEMLNYSVDVSINGQQFTNSPVVFRFYDVKITAIRPDNVMSDGGTLVRIEGEGFFDTSNKKVIFRTQFGERLIEITWDKKDRCYTLSAPPITWLLGGQQPSPELIEEVKRSGVDTLLTLSGVEWITVGKFYYIDPEVTRIAPVTFAPTVTEDERKHQFAMPQEEIDPLAGIVNEPDRVKKREEIKKLLDAEDAEILTQFKKVGAYLYLFGANFIDTPNLVAQFIYGGNKAIVSKAFYKNSIKIGVQIPEIDDLPTGIHEVFIEISLNNQQFSHSKKSFKLLAFDKNMSAQERQKFEDEENKKLKKPPGKK